MRRTAALLITIAGLWTLPAGADGPTIEAAQQACTALKEGNPRVSEGIGVVFDKSVPRDVVEAAVERWAACEGYRTAFPPLFIGEKGDQTYEVRFVNASSGQPFCGTFLGRTIVLYAFAIDRSGIRRPCGSRVDLLAHELGHVLGLRDAPWQAECRGYTMAHLHVTKRNPRQVQPSECRAAAERWLTKLEKEPDSAPVLIAGVD